MGTFVHVFNVYHSACVSRQTCGFSLRRLFCRSIPSARSGSALTSSLCSRLNLIGIALQPAPSLKGQFGPKGALYSGWESRRHNPTHDWCIIKLGAPGYIVGFDIDTCHFRGNEAPATSVEACFVEHDQVPLKWDDDRVLSKYRSNHVYY